MPQWEVDVQLRYRVWVDASTEAEAKQVALNKIEDDQPSPDGLQTQARLL